MNIKLHHTLVSYTLQPLLKDYHLTQKNLAESTGIPAPRLNAMIKGKQRMTIEYAIRIDHYTGTDPQNWQNLQNEDDFLSINQEEKEKIKATIKPLKRAKLRETKLLP